MSLEEVKWEGPWLIQPSNIRSDWRTRTLRIRRSTSVQSVRSVLLQVHLSSASLLTICSPAPFHLFWFRFCFLKFLYEEISFLLNTVKDASTFWSFHDKRTSGSSQSESSHRTWLSFSVEADRRHQRSSGVDWGVARCVLACCFSRCSTFQMQCFQNSNIWFLAKNLCCVNQSASQLWPVTKDDVINGWSLKFTRRRI